MSVWDEKPEFPLDFTTKYEHYKGLIRYWQQKNDAWLEKVKAHYDRLEGIVGALEEMGVLAVYDMEHWSTDYAKLKEKAQKYDAHEWVTKETAEGEIQDIYHIDELATAVEDRRKLKQKLEAVKKWFHRLDTAVYKMSIGLPPEEDRYVQVKAKALRDTMLMRDRIKDALEAGG